MRGGGGRLGREMERLEEGGGRKGEEKRRWEKSDCPHKKNDRISRFSKSPEVTYMYVQVKNPSSGCSNYDGSNGGYQVVLLYNQKVHVDRWVDGWRGQENIRF